MKKLVCSACGANEFDVIDGKYKCLFCGTYNYFSKDEIPTKDSVIDLEDDISRLLLKCEEDSVNAKKYANMILDIDPNNSKALKYI